MSIDQVGIALTGVVAVFLTQSKHESRRRWACVFGTLGQPFWIYAAISAHQLGVLLVSVLYTLAWLHGVDVHWLQPWIEKRIQRSRSDSAFAISGLPSVKKFPPMPPTKTPRAE